jgi:hypothetical protein
MIINIIDSRYTYLIARSMEQSGQRRIINGSKLISISKPDVRKS